MLPKGVDPLFPNKRQVGTDAFGRPVYDMAATGLTVSLPYRPEGNIFAITPEIFTDEEMRVINKQLLDRAMEVLYGKE